MFEINEAFRNKTPQHIVQATQEQLFGVEGNKGEYNTFVPEPLVEHFNLPFESALEAVQWCVFTKLHHVDGDKWDFHKPKALASILWKELGDTPINDEEEIDTDFFIFEKGTHREEIWSWFEETFNLSIAEDLMFPPPDLIFLSDDEILNL